MDIHDKRNAYRFWSTNADDLKANQPFAAFAIYWTAFNALYKINYSGKFPAVLKRDRDLLQRFCADADHFALHAALVTSDHAYKAAVNYFEIYPVKDMRSTPPAVPPGNVIPASTSMCEVFNNVYQVRNNLVHGDKLGNQNDAERVSNAMMILSTYLTELMAATAILTDPAAT
jgi:hypothetical protein